MKIFLLTLSSAFAPSSMSRTSAGKFSIGRALSFVLYGIIVRHPRSKGKFVGYVAQRTILLIQACTQVEAVSVTV